MTENHPPATAPPPPAAAARIRVLPGSTLSLPTPPPPPSHPPPQPVHLYKIAVIGDALSGKSSLVDKFLIRKSAARRTTTSISGSNYAGADNDNNSNNGGGGIHWCNASATSQGTFGTVQSTTTTNFTSASSSSLATYSKKDIALTKSSSSRSSSSRRYETTCVRAQVWDVNVPQSAIENIDNNYSWKNGRTNDVSNKGDSTSSVASSSMQQQQQYNPTENSISPLLLPLLNRINGIILTCPCPSPPSFSSSSNVPTLSSQETNNTTTDYNDCCKSINSISNNDIKSNNVHNHNGNSSGTWQELELLEVQIAKWMNFIHGHVGGLNGNSDVSNNNNDNSNNNNNHPYKIFLMLTFADLAITHYSPNEWIQLSLKLEHLCGKFGICSWRMGTCVDNSSGSDATLMDNLSTPQDQQWHRQGRQYGLLEQMARQQQQMMEEMEDSVEGLFIDMILLHLDG